MKLQIATTLLLFMMSLSSSFAQKPYRTVKKAIKRSEKRIRKLLNDNRIPGMAVTVIKNDHIIWQRGYGYADLSKNRAVDPKQTLFRVASVSKPIAATGLAKMLEDRHIDLEASIYTYLPYFPEKKYDISIKQLGGHLSGIRGYKGKEFVINTSLSIKEGIDLFKNDTLLFAPGTRYLYSSYNWNLIALAMEEVSGVSFETYIRENVLEPLQMHHTIAPTKDTKLPKAVFYSRNSKKERYVAPEVDNTYKLASGGYLSTSDDIAKLGAAYLRGDFIAEASVAQFLTAQKVEGVSTDYGVGWEVSADDKNRPFYGHTGNGIGGYAFFRIYPAQNMVFAILINQTNPQIDKELLRIVDRIIDAVVKP